MTALLSGGFALGGGLGGVILSGRLALRTEKRRIMSDDERRWLNDRRQVYSAYLALAESMLQQIDRFGTFLRYDENAEDISEEDEEIIGEGLLDYHMRWDDELQPALGEVQLMASPKVVELTERTSSALMEIGGEIEIRGTFTEYHVGWYMARDMIQVLRNEMRIELGLPEANVNQFPRSEDWPWLSDRPSRETYIQRRSGSSSPLPIPPERS